MKARVGTIHSGCQGRDVSPGNLEAKFATIWPKQAEATVANKFNAQNYYQNTSRGFHPRFQSRDFKNVNLSNIEQVLQSYRQVSFLRIERLSPGFRIGMREEGFLVIPTCYTHQR